MARAAQDLVHVTAGHVEPGTVADHAGDGCRAKTYTRPGGRSVRRSYETTGEVEGYTERGHYADAARTDGPQPSRSHLQTEASCDLPSQSHHLACGSPAVDGAPTYPPERAPRVAGRHGADAHRKWPGADLLVLDKLRAPASPHACDGCVWSCTWAARRDVAPGRSGTRTQPADVLAPPHPRRRGPCGHLRQRQQGREAHDPLVAHVAPPGPWWLVVADMAEQLIPWAEWNLSTSTRNGAVFLDDEPVSVGDLAVIEAMAHVLTVGATKGYGGDRRLHPGTNGRAVPTTCARSRRRGASAWREHGSGWRYGSRSVTRTPWPPTGREGSARSRRPPTRKRADDQACQPRRRNSPPQPLPHPRQTRPMKLKDDQAERLRTLTVEFLADLYRQASRTAGTRLDLWGPDQQPDARRSRPAPARTSGPARCSAVSSSARPARTARVFD